MQGHLASTIERPQHLHKNNRSGETARDRQSIHPSDSARNIRAIFDSTMSMLPLVNSVCKLAFYQLCNISRISKLLTSKTTEILVHAFVSSKLDYCNSRLYNVQKYVLKKPQSVQNAAAHLITCSSKYDHTLLQFCPTYTGFL